MKTDELVARLAHAASPIERDEIAGLLNHALMRGFAGSAVLLVALYGIRSDMPALILTAKFWARLVFPLAVIVTAMKLAERLGRPGARLKLAWLAVSLPVITMLAVAACMLAATPPHYRLALMLGTTWRTATFNIVLLSLPCLASVLHAMRGLAPTQLVLSGTGAGVLAGAQGILVYSLNCAEMEVPFWSVWYVLAIIVTGGIGATIGPRSLRW